MRPPTGGRTNKTFGECDMKTQMKFQKILTLVTLILAALSFVLGVFFCSGIIEKCRYYTSASLPVDPVTNQPLKDAIGADALFDYSQKMNDVFVIMAIVLILVVVTLYITATNKRRNYYVTNYVSIGLVVVYSVVFAIVLLVICGTCVSLAGKIDMAQWKAYIDYVDSEGAHKYTDSYSESYATIVLGFILAVIILLDAVAWCLNLLWKIKLMKGEKELLAGGFAKEVA